MKIVSSGRVLNSREFYEKKKKRRNVRLVLYTLLLLSVICLIIFLLRQEKFFISGVVIMGENVVDKDEMTKIVRQQLGGNYLWLVPRANALVYPRQAIKRGLLSRFPRLKSVNLNVDGQYKLSITIDERTPFALYCPKVGDCYFLDGDGFIFALAPSFSRGVYFVYIDENMSESPIGKKFLTDTEFKSLLTFLEKLKSIDIQPSSLHIGKDGYAFVLPLDGQIMWRRGTDINIVLSNLEAFLASDAIRAQSNFLDRIFYLDLRTENKVFYKFKE